IIGRDIKPEEIDYLIVDRANLALAQETYEHLPLKIVGAESVEANIDGLYNGPYILPNYKDKINQIAQVEGSIWCHIARLPVETYPEEATTKEEDSKSQRDNEVVRKLRDKITVREKAGGDATKEKIALIEQLHVIHYTDEDKRIFDAWLEQAPESSIENPIAINTIEDVAKFLPQQGNYRDEKINLFFKKEDLSPDELRAILEKFSQSNPDFEISVVRHNDAIFSVGIGDKARNRSTILDGEYFGHYHPTQFEFENKEILPNCFVLGLMPSAGDIKGFLKHAETVKDGTRIFSKNGYILIKPISEAGDPSKTLDEFNRNYFDLFLGVNNLGLKSDEAVADYFKKSFGFDIEFHYSEGVKI
ncbi:MAG: hypothetical protein RIQ54_91, partial [Candidatus Parcubacteria bacterium]